MKSTASRRAAILVGLLLFLPNTAFASIDFHFEDAERNVENVPLLPRSGSSSVTVTTTGHLVGQNDPDAAHSFITPLGLAVKNTTVRDDRSRVPLTITRAIDTFLVDSDNGAEFLRMEFSVPAQFELVWFRDAGPGERFSMVADGQAIDVVALLGTDEITRIHPAGKVTFPNTMPYATTYDFYAHSSFNVQNGKVNVVPEPTTVFVWCGLGMTVLGWRHGRRGIQNEKQ